MQAQAQARAWAGPSQRRSYPRAPAPTRLPSLAHMASLYAWSTVSRSCAVPVMMLPVPTYLPEEGISSVILAGIAIGRQRRTAARSIKPRLSCPVLTLAHHTPPPPSLTHPSIREERERETEESHGQGGERGAGARRAGAQGLLRPAAGAAVRHGGAPDVVLLPGAHRRVRRHAALPLHHRRHRHRLQGAVGERPVRRRRRARHRLGLRRHDLRPRLLHRRHLGGPHQPGRHLRAPPGAEGVAAARGDVHRGAVRGRHRGRRHRQGHHEGRVPGQRRRRQHGRLRLLPRHGPRGGDRRHLRAGVHRLLRHRPQAQRPRLPRPRAGPAPHRFRRLHGAPRHHPHHRHRHQPRQEPRRRSHLQQEGRMGQPLDLLGRPVRGSAGGGGVPPVHPPGGGHQGARLLPEQPEQLSLPAGRPII